MTDQTTEQSGAPTTVQIDPVAAVNLLSAEREFYRNRCLLLEHEVLTLRRQAQTGADVIKKAKTEPKVMNDGNR